MSRKRAAGAVVSESGIMEKPISSKIVFECPVFKVEEATVELPNGQHQQRWYVVKRDAVGLVTIDSDSRILLTREYRSAAGEIRWRIPAGGVKEGESPEDAAHRELREETGLDCKSLTSLLEAKNPSALIKQKTHFYLAKDLFASPLKSEEWEHIELVPKEPREVQALIQSGEIQGGIALALTNALKAMIP